MAEKRLARPSISISQHSTKQKRFCLLSQVRTVRFSNSFTTVSGAPVERVSTSIILVFLISNGIVKMVLNIMERRKISIGRLLC